MPWLYPVEIALKYRQTMAANLRSPGDCAGDNL